MKYATVEFNYVNGDQVVYESVNTDTIENGVDGCVIFSRLRHDTTPCKWSKVCVETRGLRSFEVLEED